MQAQLVIEKLHAGVDKGAMADDIQLKTGWSPVVAKRSEKQLLGELTPS